MAAQGQTIDTISEIFGSPLVKAVLAALTVFAAIIKYIKDAGERRARAATIAERYGLKGSIFWLINRFPHLLHQAVAFAILIAAALEIGILADQYTFKGAILTALPGPAQAIAGFLSYYFVGLVFFVLALYIVFELRGFERFLAWLIGLFPRFRNSLEWANAKWQIKSDAAERQILAPSTPGIEEVANRLIGELANAPRNDSLALRPITLSEDSAANVLYFGHVIEQYRSVNSSGSLPWTRVYEALARVAETAPAPFSPEGIKEFDRQQSFFAVLLQANAHLELASRIPNEPGLEQAVETALTTLRNRWGSDARRLSKGFFGTDYGGVLRRSKRFLTEEGMRRQFAKLFIIWNLIPGASRPSIFRIPFNAKMFIQYLDEKIIRADGERFDFTTDPVTICFDAIQGKILSRVFTLLNETKDETRVAWRNAEKADVDSRHLDWTWWVYYRADQQAYHDARSYESENWKQEANQEVVAAG